MSAEDLADRLWHQMGASYPEFVVATREALAQAWDEGRKATWTALGAPFIWFAPENPYEETKQ